MGDEFMIFAILFILAFLMGLAIYVVTNKWMLAVLLPMCLFLFTTLADTEARESWGFTLIFGMPIVFFASLLSAYVVELRRGEEADEVELHSETPEENP